MASSDAIDDDLLEIYEALTGKEFSGKYIGKHEMPLKGTQRDVLVIDCGAPLAATLREISKAVLNKYPASAIWKGITGPEDSARFTDYWLWVPCVSEELLEGINYNFKVKECQVFEGTEFLYGINIKVVVID